MAFSSFFIIFKWRENRFLAQMIASPLLHSSQSRMKTFSREPQAKGFLILSLAMTTPSLPSQGVQK